MTTNDPRPKRFTTQQVVKLAGDLQKSINSFMNAAFYNTETKDLVDYNAAQTFCVTLDNSIDKIKKFLQPEFKPTAGITFTNAGGIELMIKGETVLYRFAYGLDGEEIFETEIQFDQEGAAYFIHRTDISETDQVYYFRDAINL